MKLTVDLWDVGQGNSTVVTLPDSSVVLIDVGPRNSPIVEWLKRTQKIIHSIVITHNDSDHIGGLPSIVGDASQEIRTVYLVRDPKSEKPSPTFCRLIRSLEERKRLGKTKVYTLTCGINVWQDGECSLKVRFPDYLANIKATDPNQTSGILTLEDERQVFLIWGGDAALTDIDQVCKKTNSHFLDGPHHGAPQDKGLRTTEFKRLLGSIGSKRLHISVGTNNTYSHPNRDYLVAASTRGLKVTCTELTTRCGSIVPKRPVFSANALLGLPTCLSGCPCRGTTRLWIEDGNLILDTKNDDAHSQNVTSRVTHALCRKI